MNRYPCPSCGRSLLWNGIRRAENQFNVEGKRWYQFAGFVVHCKHCGVRLQPPHEGAIGWLLVFMLFNALVIQPFLIAPLRAEFGFGVVFGFLAVVLLPVVFLWQRSNYRLWQPPSSDTGSSVNNEFEARNK
jgi:hypothetical protein